MDLSNIPADLLMARGKYATVRSEHEDAKKRMQMLCGLLGATSAQILRAIQPDNDGIPDASSIGSLLASGRNTLSEIEACAAMIADLAEQRSDLKRVAWPK